MRCFCFPKTWLYAFAVLLLTMHQPLLAQRHRKQEKLDINRNLNFHKEKRKSLKQAKRYESEYKDTHLNVAAYQYKPGSVGHKTTDEEEYSFKYKTSKMGKGMKSRKSLLSRLFKKD